VHAAAAETALKWRVLPMQGGPDFVRFSCGTTHNPKEPVMSRPAVESLGYQKSVLRWDERPAAGTSEYEAIQRVHSPGLIYVQG
jgi:hypothetical protein